MATFGVLNPKPGEGITSVDNTLMDNAFIDDNLDISGIAELSVATDDTTIRPRHIQGCIGAHGILFHRSPVTAHLKPAESVAQSPVGIKMQVTAHTGRIIVAYQRRKDVAVGGSLTRNFAEIDVTNPIGIIGNQQDIVFSFLCATDLASLVPMGRIAARNHFLSCQTRRARLGRGVERSPTAKVNIYLRGAVHVDVHVTRREDAHIVPGRIGSGAKARIIRSRLTYTGIHTCGKLIQAIVGAKRVSIGTQVVLCRSLYALLFYQSGKDFLWKRLAPSRDIFTQFQFRQVGIITEFFDFKHDEIRQVCIATSVFDRDSTIWVKAKAKTLILVNRIGAKQRFLKTVEVE